MIHRTSGGQAKLKGAGTVEVGQENGALMLKAHGSPRSVGGPDRCHERSARYSQLLTSGFAAPGHARLKYRGIRARGPTWSDGLVPPLLAQPARARRWR